MQAAQRAWASGQESGGDDFKGENPFKPKEEEIVHV